MLKGETRSAKRTSGWFNTWQWHFDSLQSMLNDNAKCHSPTDWRIPSQFITRIIQTKMPVEFGFFWGKNRKMNQKKRPINSTLVTPNKTRNVYVALAQFHSLDPPVYVIKEKLFSWASWIKNYSTKAVRPSTDNAEPAVRKRHHFFWKSYNKL